MDVITTAEGLHQSRGTGEPQTWGLVPTMGYLHAGHLSLVDRARRENDRVAVSLFVNPTQFGEQGDLDNYPRAMDRDLRLLQEAGVDLVFTPEDGVMYPPGYQTWVQVDAISKPLEGSSRPTHFRGVATVVAKLFNLIRPHRAYFGQKDAQQCAVVERMVADLNFPLEVVVCPTVREDDGLAMSSRNARLSPPQRAAAPVVYQALLAGERALAEGETSAEAVRQRMRQTIATEPLAQVDYVSVADPASLEELDRVSGRALLSLAVVFEPVRLIDNLLAEGRS